MSLKSYVCFIKSRWNLFFFVILQYNSFFFCIFCLQRFRETEMNFTDERKKRNSKNSNSWELTLQTYVIPPYFFFSWNQLWLCERLGQSKWHFYGKMALVLMVSKYKLVHLTKTLLPKIEKKMILGPFFMIYA